MGNRAYADITYEDGHYDEETHAKIPDCLYATCEDGGTQVGPVYGHGENSVKRALAQLTEECDCGATFHADAEDR